MASPEAISVSRLILKISLKLIPNAFISRLAPNCGAVSSTKSCIAVAARSPSAAVANEPVPGVKGDN